MSRNVIFHEHVLLYKSTTQSSFISWNYFPSTIDIPTNIDRLDHVHNTPTSTHISLIDFALDNDIHHESNQPNVHHASPNEPSINNAIRDSSTNNTIHDTLKNNTIHLESNVIDQHNPSTKTSSIMRHHQSYLQDYICNSSTIQSITSKGTLYLLPNPFLIKINHLYIHIIHYLYFIILNLKIILRHLNMIVGTKLNGCV